MSRTTPPRFQGYVCMPLSAGSVDTPHTPPSISAPRPRAERAPAPSVSEIRVSLSPVSRHTPDSTHTDQTHALAISDSVYRSTGVLFYSRALALLVASGDTHTHTRDTDTHSHSRPGVRRDPPRPTAERNSICSFFSIFGFNWNVLQIRICRRKSASLSSRHLKSSMNSFSFFI